MHFSWSSFTSTLAVLALTSSLPSGLTNPVPGGGGGKLSEIIFTYYWPAYPSEYDGKNPSVTLNDCDGKPLTGKVSQEYAEAARKEGSAFIEGKLLNLAGCGDSTADNFNIFKEYDGKKYPYGVGSESNPLEPYVSVAANDLTFGEFIYVPELDGLPLPDNQVHDGCLRVDDVCGTCDGGHIDFLVASSSTYKAIHKEGKFTSCSVQRNSDCRPKKYTVDKSFLNGAPGSKVGATVDVGGYNKGGKEEATKGDEGEKGETKDDPYGSSEPTSTTEESYEPSETTSEESYTSATASDGYTKPSSPGPHKPCVPKGKKNKKNKKDKKYKKDKKHKKEKESYGDDGY